MKIPWYWMLGIVLMLASTMILSALQTSLWFQLFGRFPSPMFWLIILVYVSVTRPLWEATLIVYLLTLVSAPFTAFPFAGLLVYSLMLMVMLIMIRERVFWGGSTYFMLMVGVACVTAPLAFWLCSRWFDKNPIFMPAIFDWLIAGCLTALFSLPLYRFYQWIDHVASQDAGSETRVGPR